MARARPRLVPVLLAAAASLLAFVAGAAGQTERQSGTIGVEEIRRGMRGYGLTVFQGTTPERFDVEVIDVLHNFRPDQDLILVRTEHPTLEHATTVGGMSGSPIYFDGRLAGAYAYGWPFGLDPIAGVTPIRNMLSELRRPLRPDAIPGLRPLARRADGRPSGDPNRLAGLPAYRGGPVEAFDALRAHRAARATASPSAAVGVPNLAPASTPIMLGGFTPTAVRLLEAELGGLGLDVLQAGGGGDASANAPTRFVDGGAVGVQLMRGDLNATAIGTVTYVEGQRLAAFGHPMMNAGQPGLPTAIARVLHILASRARSFKIAEAVRPAGTLVQDRQSAIIVDADLEAPSVELTIRIRGVEGASRTEWNARVASHRLLTPALIGAATVNALSATVSDIAAIRFDATSRVRVSGRDAPIEVRDRGFSASGIASGALLSQLRTFAILAAIQGNPFEAAYPEAVELNLDLSFDRNVVRVVDASVAAREVDPGSTVPLRVVLAPFDGPEEVRVIPVTIPRRLAGETVRVLVQGGGGVRVESAIPRSLDELLEAVQEGYDTHDLVVSVATRSRGLRLGGHVVRSLPRSALDTLQPANTAGRMRPFATHERQRVPMERLVTGGARVDLTVRRQARR